MRQPISRLWCCVFVAGALFGQTRLHLKTEPTAEVQQAEPIARQLEPARKRSFDRQHVLVQFEGVPAEEAVAELERRGARFVQYVPDSGYLFSVWSGQDWWGTNLRVSRMRAQDKVSPALPKRDNAGKRDGRGTLVVEFHPDVDPAEGLGIVQQEGFEVLAHPDLLGNHLLIRGPLDRIEELAAWDEVAYVFPASAELAAGERVVACPGALTALGTVGQYVAAVGEGWDGPGQGSAAVGYYFQRLTQKLPRRSGSRGDSESHAGMVARGERGVQPCQRSIPGAHIELPVRAGEPWRRRILSMARASSWRTPTIPRRRTPSRLPAICISTMPRSGWRARICRFVRWTCIRSPCMSWGMRWGWDTRTCRVR